MTPNGDKIRNLYINTYFVLGQRVPRIFARELCIIDDNNNNTNNI